MKTTCERPHGDRGQARPMNGLLTAFDDHLIAVDSHDRTMQHTEAPENCGGLWKKGSIVKAIGQS